MTRGPVGFRISTDLGDPVSYLVLADRTPVVTSDGHELGTVEHVLAVPDADVFDGVIVDTDHGHRFADASQIDRIHERGVVLELDDKLRRAWDYLSGSY